MEATSQNPTFILVREKKSALLACLWLSIISVTHVEISWLAHTCLCAVTITNVSRHLCEEVTFTWSWLDHVTCWFMFAVKSRSWLILVLVPSLYLWLWEFFTPPTLTFISCTLHSFTRTHMIPLYLEQVSYERRHHLRLFRLGLTRVLLLFFLVWKGHLNSIPNCHSGTYLLRGFDHFIEDQNFWVEILEKNPSPWDDSNTFWWRPRAKIQPLS